MSSAGVDDWTAPAGNAGADDWVTPGAAAAPSVAPKGGLGRNFRAGATEGVTSIPSAILDPASHVLDAIMPFLPENKAPEDSTAYALGAGRKNVNPIPAGSVTHALNKGLGLIGLNPEDVSADTTPERISRMAGMGATSVLFPEGGEEALASRAAAEAAPKLATKVTSRAANTPLASAARRAVTGTAVGTGAGAAGEAVPDSMPELKLPVQILSSIAMGAAAEAPGLAKAAAPAVKKFAQPFTESGQAQVAADTLRNRAENPLLATDLDKETPDLVPGSKPTTFQQTGDMGLGSLEREQAAKNPAPFLARRADQNAARTQALTSIQQGGDPDAVATFLRGQFRNFDDQTQQHIDALTAHAQAQADALGGHGAPEEHGAALRESLQTAENAARTRERSLWQAVDPDRNLVLATDPTVQAATDIAGSLSPSAKPMAGEEKAIFDLASNYGPQMPFADMSDLRSRLSAAMREELITNGQTPAYARMSRLRGAIQNNLSEAAAAQAAADAKAVASGTMAPDQTLVGKIQGWVDDFYGNRAAQSGAASGEGFGASAARRSPSSGSPDGAGLPPEGGLAGSEGTEGIPPGPQPFDEAAAERLGAATAATRERVQTFGQGPTKQVLAKAGTQDAYRLPEARVPEKYFHAGPTSFQDIQGLRQSVGDERALPILRDYAASSLRRAAERPDGTLDPRRVAAWQQKYGNAMRAFPELETQFGTAADASEAIARATSDRRDAIADRNASALGRVMNAQSGEDVTKTVGSIFGKANATSAMSDLVQAASRSPEATAGLRQAVADHITRNFISNTEAGTSGVNLFKADAFQTFVRRNRTALAQVFSPEEMGTLDAIAADLHRANRSITAVKLPGGSNTAQDIHGIIANSPNASVLDKLLANAVVISAGHAVKGVTGSIMGLLGVKAVGAARSAGFEKADQMVTEALLNPDFARALLRRAPADHEGGQAVALASRMRRIGLGILATRLGTKANPQSQQ